MDLVFSFREEIRWSFFLLFFSFCEEIRWSLVFAFSFLSGKKSGGFWLFFFWGKKCGVCFFDFFFSFWDEMRWSLVFWLFLFFLASDKVKVFFTYFFSFWEEIRWSLVFWLFLFSLGRNKVECQWQGSPPTRIIQSENVREGSSQIYKVILEGICKYRLKYIRTEIQLHI